MDLLTPFVVLLAAAPAFLVLVLASRRALREQRQRDKVEPRVVTPTASGLRFSSRVSEEPPRRPGDPRG